MLSRDGVVIELQRDVVATPSVDAGAGSGLSDGAFVTLGIPEARDVRCVLEWLSSRKDVSALALWGQSMGAALRGNQPCVLRRAVTNRHRHAVEQA